ncbi:MAG: cell division protein FtsZ, partial [bacterium]|nr:cell division protein FtsZ [bacterium]
VIGIGGGGGNIVSGIASKISKASFVVADTDIKSLKNCSRKVMKFQFGQSLTHGLGTGMNPEVGDTAAQNDKEKIKKLCQGYDLCVLVASLGGGVGSGSVSTFAKISRNLGNLTYGIFTLPFKFEGERKTEIALNTLREVKAHFNAITFIPNERVFQVVNKDTPLKEALSSVNKFLSESLGGLIETIYEPGLINIDFADFRTVMEGNGRIAYLNTVEAQLKGDGAKDLVETVLKSPFYPYTIRGAKGVLFNIIGEKDLSLSSVSQMSKAISDLVSPEAKIIFGISQQKKSGSAVRTVLLATGCDRSDEIRIVSEKKKKKKKPVPVKKEEIAEPKIGKPKSKTVIRKKKKPVEKKPGEISEIKEQEVVIDGEGGNSEEKVRKNALQIKKESEDMEKEMAEKERFWETPAFLRKK